MIKRLFLPVAAGAIVSGVLVGLVFLVMGSESEVPGSVVITQSQSTPITETILDIEALLHEKAQTQFHATLDTEEMAWLLDTFTDAELRRGTFTDPGIGPTTVAFCPEPRGDDGVLGPCKTWYLP